ncbi:PD-(D/E)XK nuclease family protein [Olivibacter sitiensis]|uniref:PD-(D/E)XK nuclease family protein n=1 Tax=Olivibacter sitiensis TaxID=376470 RepID=UPI0003F64453|nr:PD-(D/E)XK nuclease family protein [Olivibacter sitiensis]
MLPFLKEVSQDIIKRYERQLDRVAIVFNNKRPEVYLRKYLAQDAGKAIWSPSFFTIQEFIAAASPTEPADDLSQFFALLHEYNGIMASLGREESSPDRFYPLAETILSDFAQIDYEMAHVDEVYSQLYDIALFQQQFPHFSEEQMAVMQQFWSSFNSERQHYIQERFLELWQILPQLYERFKTNLQAQNKGTLAGMYRSLAEGNKEQNEFLGQFHQVLFIGFNALNKSEATLFSHWQKEGLASFYFDSDVYYLNDVKQEAGYFLRHNIDRLGLRNAHTGNTDFISNKSNTLKIVKANGFSAQAKALAGLIQEERDMLGGNAAVLLADEKLLLPVLQSLPKEIDPNITMGFPVMQSPVFGLVDLWITHHEQAIRNKRHEVPYQHLHLYLSHPMHRPFAEEENLKSKCVENKWLQVPLQALLALGGEIAQFFSPLTDAETAMAQLVAVLRQLFSHRRQQALLTHTEAAIIAEVIKRLIQLADNLKRYGTMDMQFVLRLIRNSLMGIRAGIEGDPLSGVQVMGLLESRNLDFQHIYILGANEGILPRISASPSFIPYSLRKAHGLPVLENQDALSAYLFYRLLQRAEHITIVYNSQVDEQSTGEPSRFIQQLAFESPFKFQYLTQQQPVQGIVESHPLEIAKSGRVWDALATYLDDANPSRPGLSATAFTNYIQSPLLFFLKNIAKLKEPEKLSEEFELNKIGSVLHEVMQWFYEDLKNEDPYISAERIIAKKADVPRLSLQALSHVFYGDRRRLDTQGTKSMETIILRIVQDYVSIFLEKDIETAPFRIVELENKEDYTVLFPITVAGQLRHVKLYGIIDRIDEKDGTLRIVDYKSGADELQFTSMEELFDYSSGKSNKALLQTLYYTYIYERAKTKQGVEPHLYAVRRMRKEGSLFYTKRQRQQQVLAGDFLSETKVDFLARLRITLEEIFNKEVPFYHRAEVDLKYADAYSEFLSYHALRQED